VSFSKIFGYMPKLSRKRMLVPVIYRHGTERKQPLSFVMIEDFAIMKLQ
jgi:hypothetical protein